MVVCLQGSSVLISVINKVGKVQTYFDQDYLLHINALYIFMNLPKTFACDQVSCL